MIEVDSQWVRVKSPEIDESNKWGVPGPSSFRADAVEAIISWNDTICAGVVVHFKGGGRLRLIQITEREIRDAVDSVLGRSG